MATTLGRVLKRRGATPTDRSTPSPAPTARATRAAISVTSAVPLAGYVYVALRRIAYPFELEWLEGGAVEIVNRVVHGQGIYVAPTLHYVAYPYPPLYFWISAGLAKLIGVGFLAPRIVSFISSLGSFVVLWRMVQKETRDPVAGLVAAGIFAAAFEVSGAWFDLARVDSLFILLLLLAVSAARVARNWRGGMTVGLLLFLAFFTKQTALLAAVPLLVYLGFVRWRVAVGAVVTLALFLVVSTTALDWTSHGWYSYFVFHELPNQGINAKALRTFIPTSLLRPTGWAIAIALAGIVLSCWRQRSRGIWPFWIVVSAGLVGASWLSLVHAGGSSNVLIPAYAGVAICTGLGYDAIRRADVRRPGLVGALVAGILVVQVVQLSHRPLHESPSASSEAAGRQFIALVASIPGQVIVADHPWYDTLAGKPSWAQSEAVHDVLRAGPSVARTDLLASIAATLRSASVTTVFADDPGDTIGPDFHRYFTLGPPVFRCARCFFPVTDVPRRPYLRFDRR